MLALADRTVLRSPMSSLHPGVELDHYRIERLVARSGMASIYQATDLRSSRRVALKIPTRKWKPILFF